MPKIDINGKIRDMTAEEIARRRQPGKAKTPLSMAARLAALEKRMDAAELLAAQKGGKG